VTASKKELEALHGVIARKLTEAIETMAPGDKGLAAVLNVARQFVKDNNVEAIPTEGSDMGRLVNRLAEYPFDPESDGVTH
jgi:hypothetical protein